MPRIIEALTLSLSQKYSLSKSATIYLKVRKILDHNTLNLKNAIYLIGLITRKYPNYLFREALGKLDSNYFLLKDKCESKTMTTNINHPKNTTKPTPQSTCYP